MELDKFKNHWQQKITPLSENIILENKMHLLESKMQQLDKEIAHRTLYGYITFSIIIISILTLDYFLYMLQMPLLAVLGILSWVLCLAVTMIRLFKIKKSYANNNLLSIEDSLKAKLIKIESETAFYQSIVYWILAPMSIGFIMILIATEASLMASFIEFGMFFFFSHLAYQYNQRYIAKNLQPLEAELKIDLKAIQ